jgi:hypothetical protein
MNNGELSTGVGIPTRSPPTWEDEEIGAAFAAPFDYL